MDTTPLSENRLRGGPFIGMPAWAAVALHAVFIIAFLSRAHWDLSALACVGAERLDQPPYSAVTSGFATGGYDGQYYYVLGQNPFLTHEMGIDVPAARHLRILYPLLCWLLSMGQTPLLIWTMPLVNLAGIAIITQLGAGFLATQTINRWWAFMLPLALGLGMPLLRDLTDIVANAALLATIIALLLSARPVLIFVVALLALCAREQNIVPLAFLIASTIYLRRSSHAVPMIAAIAGWIAWVALVRFSYGTSPFLPVPGNFSLPFAGFFSALRGLKPGFKGAVALAGLCTIFANTALAIYFLSKPAALPIRALLVCALVLAVIAGPAIYASPWSSLRVLAILPLSVWLAAMDLRRPKLTLLQLPAMICSLAAVVSNHANIVIHR